jgi:predicted PurR-regulated permease PerM
MPTTFNNRLRQIILLAIILLLAMLLLKQLNIFLPGFLGAITGYILLRESYFRLTIVKKWGKSTTALLFIGASLLVIGIPTYFAIELLTTQIGSILSNPMQLLADGKIIDEKIHAATGVHLLSDENLKSLQTKAANILPRLINSSASIVSNLAILFFVLYFLLKNGREIERFLDRSIPLREENIDLLGNETKNMIRANAIGIPILAILQGIIAVIGYWIFGVQDFVLWGFITGIFSMVPIVGTAIIWVPLCLYMYATDKTGSAIGLLIYAAVLITNIDYVARLTILRRFMNVHPIITIFGVIVGVGLFGFWGVIFGPLLISYFIILVRIYINEFATPKSAPEA